MCKKKKKKVTAKHHTRLFWKETLPTVGLISAGNNSSSARIRLRRKLIRHQNSEETTQLGKKKAEKTLERHLFRQRKTKYQETETEKVEQSLISLASISPPFDLRLTYKANTTRSAVAFNVNNSRGRTHWLPPKTLSWTLFPFILRSADDAVIIIFSCRGQTWRGI